MICEGCQAGADNMADYRKAAEEDDQRRKDAGEEPLEADAALRWIQRRARMARVLHCKGPGKKREIPGCTCQCEIPELKSADRA